MLKIAFGTDFHWGRPCHKHGRIIKHGPLARAYMEALGQLARENGADVVVTGGDNISSIRYKPYDRWLQQQFCDAARREFGDKWRPLAGNNEDRTLSRSELSGLAEKTFASWTEILNGFRLIYWNPAHAGDDDSEDYTAQAADLGWLAEAVARDPHMPAIVFTHIPCDRTEESLHSFRSMGGNRKKFWRNSERVREALSGGNVSLVVTGHQHRFWHSFLDDIHYITMQAPIRPWKETKEGWGSLMLLQAAQDRLRVNITGKAAHTFDLIPGQQPEFRPFSMKTLVSSAPGALQP